ncbi:hypothetical protein ACRAWD_23375 [Caulobacter segnis]
MGINIDTDTTFLMMMEAQERGHKAVVLHAGQAVARGRPGVRPEPSRWTCSPRRRAPSWARRSCRGHDQDDVDVAPMRQDPPCSTWPASAGAIGQLLPWKRYPPAHPDVNVGINRPAEGQGNGHAPEKLVLVNRLPGACVYGRRP